MSAPSNAIGPGEIIGKVPRIVPSLARTLYTALPLTVHKFCSMLPALVFEAYPVIRVEDAVRGELEVIAWRDGLKG